jgi:Cu2+-exporting ATPase
VRAEVAGHQVRVGNARFLLAAGLSLDAAARRLARDDVAGRPLVYVGIDDDVAGLVVYHDPPRPEGRAVVSWLRAHGVAEIHLVTGDEVGPAQAVADALDIRQVHAGLLPDDKAAVVQALQRQGRVIAYVGEGVDDRLAFVLADVSVALRHGPSSARDTADVVLMESSLWGIPHAIELARTSQRLIHENWLLVGTCSTIGLGLGMFRGLGPVAARLFGDGGALLAAGNSLRPLIAPRWREPRAAQALAAATATEQRP